MSPREITLSRFANRFSGYTELRVQQNTSTNITLVNGDVTTNARSAHGGVSARVFRDGIWGFATRPGLATDEIVSAVDEATRNAEFLAGRAARGPEQLPTARARHEADFGTKKPRCTQSAVLDFLRGLDDHIRETYPDLRSRTVQLADLDMEKRLYNSDGSDAYSNVTRSLVIVNLVCDDQAGAPVALRKAYGGRGQFEDVFDSPETLHEAIDQLYPHLMNKRVGAVARAGTRDVILDSELAGILAHEAIGHTTEADLVQAGSVAGDFVGQPVASPLISMVDFAHTYQDETLPVPVYIDDEGVRARDIWLIKDGVLQGFMHNKESARHFEQTITGNARAYQFFDEPLIRMRNTAILPGPDNLDAMIESVDDGYYLMWPSNGQADATSEFMFGVSLGYEVKNGRIGRAIKDTTISGVAFDMLKTVSMVSDEMSWSCAGMCGKKQIIPVGMGGPSIKCRVHLGGE